MNYLNKYNILNLNSSDINNIKNKFEKNDSKHHNNNNKQIIPETWQEVLNN